MAAAIEGSPLNDGAAKTEGVGKNGEPRIDVRADQTPIPSARLSTEGPRAYAVLEFLGEYLSEDRVWIVGSNPCSVDEGALNATHRPSLKSKREPFEGSLFPFWFETVESFLKPYTGLGTPLWP